MTASMWLYLLGSWVSSFSLGNVQPAVKRKNRKPKATDHLHLAGFLIKIRHSLEQVAIVNDIGSF